jgi:uncharacterized protein YlxW (UPF0749 family)
MSSSPSGGTGSRGYLADLLTNTLDPGYAAAAARRRDGTARPISRATRVAVVAVCAVIGAVLTVAYIHTRDNAPGTSRAKRALIAKVRAAQDTAEKLADQANRLSGQVASARQRASGATPSGKELTRAEEQAGTLAVHGPGLRVTLTNPTSGERQYTDLDVRAVVNELWLSGAEAIAVNNIRLTPTSAIRFAGSAVLVDFQPLTAPYTVRAIGSPAQLDSRFTVSDVANRYRTLASAFGLGFRISQSKQLALPASDSHRNRYARPGGIVAAPTGREGGS